MADEVDKEIKRLNYFTGQFLDEKDFQDEQKYHITMRRKLNQALRGPGVLDDGFTVTCTQATTTTDAKISVGEGLGIDGKGQEIVILSNLEQEISTNELKELFGKTVKICLGYQEKLSDNKKADADISGDTRWSEAPVLTVTKDLPPEDSILLATVAVDSAGNLGEPKYPEKQYSDARFPHNLTIGQGGNGVLSVRHIDGKNWLDDAKDDLFLNYITGKNVHLGFGDNTKSSLFVSGNVGIGTTVPSAKLEVVGNVILESPSVDDICSLSLSRTDESKRRHSWSLWHMNSEYRKNALEIWEYKTDSSGKICDGNPADGAMCTPRLVILEGGNVGIGIADPKTKLQVSGGAIMPAAGNDDASGILFPENPGGGGGDKAWIRYYARSGEKTALEIGVANDALNDPANQDDILLMPSGGVGIGTREPKAMLDVEGGAFLGYENQQSDFGVPLKSGFYQGVNDVTGDVPDTGHPWTHLIAARHSNTTNNYQLQIASTFASNDRLFFRKVTADTAITNNPPWYEVATRGSNAFIGNQSVSGSLSINGGNVGIGATTVTSKLHVAGNGPILSLEGTDHAYIQWYPDSVASGRKAWIGFGSANDDNISIINEKPGQSVVIGQKLEVSGSMRASGEIQTTSPNAFRMVYGNIGSFFRNDGSDTYMLLTNSGDQYGSYNGLRPFRVSNTTGNVFINNLEVNGIFYINNGGRTDWDARPLLNDKPNFSVMMYVGTDIGGGDGINFYWKDENGEVRKARLRGATESEGW